MRSAARLSRTPAEHLDHEARARRRTLVELLTICAEARARGESWIGWIDDGRTVLTPAEWEAHVRGSGRARPRGRQTAGNA